MNRSYIAAAAVLLGCLAASAAPVDNCGFEKVPRDALIALNETRGKPFTAGAVFVNGKYLPPPYVVSRYGTAIVINGHQVTGQVIPWSKFAGARTTSAAAGSAAASKSDTTEKYEEATSLDDLFADETDNAVAGAAASDDDDDSIDDLFDDTPKPPKAKPAPKPAPKPVVVPKPASPSVESDDPSAPPQKFVHTTRTRQLLETLDKQRTTIDRDLRSNQFYFFSPRYSSVGGNLRILGSMVEKLPDAMKDATSADDLFARMRRAGLGFVSAEVCTDLYANKLTFPALYELRSRVREEIQRRKALSADGTY